MNQGIYGFPGLLPPTIVPYIDFSLTSNYPNKQGRLMWDSNYSTLSLGLTDNLDIELGQSLYKKIRNNTGSTLTKGQVVYINGAHGQSNITVALANASIEATAATTIGIVAEPILANTEGFIITQGYLRGIRTNNTTGTGGEGSILWLSTTAGSFTYDRPTAPAHGVVIGWMVKSAGTGSGSIFVSITNGQELNELHDVYVTSITNNDILQWDGVESRWENRSLSAAGIASSSHTHTLSGLTPLNQMTLVGRWASAGSGNAQEVTIGNGLKLSNTGILTTNLLEVASTSITLTAGTGLTGGGDLSTNRSFAVDFAASGTSSSTKAVRADDSRLSDARTPLAHTHLLSDFTQSGATINQVPQWNGTTWVPATISGGGGVSESFVIAMATVL